MIRARILTLAVVLSLCAAMPVRAASVDTSKLGMGFRASRVIGASVYSETNDKIGSVNDLIIDRESDTLYAVLSVGGFLGIGDRLVAVPYSVLKVDPNRVVMAGATKDSLESLPEFKYASNS